MAAPVAQSHLCLIKGKNDDGQERTTATTEVSAVRLRRRGVIFRVFWGSAQAGQGDHNLGGEGRGRGGGAVETYGEGDARREELAGVKIGGICSWDPSWTAAAMRRRRRRRRRHGGW